MSANLQRWTNSLTDSSCVIGGMKVFPFFSSPLGWRPFGMWFCHFIFEMFLSLFYYILTYATLDHYCLWIVPPFWVALLFSQSECSPIRNAMKTKILNKCLMTKIMAPVCSPWWDMPCLHMRINQSHSHTLAIRPSSLQAHHNNNCSLGIVS